VRACLWTALFHGLDSSLAQRQERRAAGTAIRSINYQSGGGGSGGGDDDDDDTGFKVVLMSATINADKFSAYFGGCPMLNVPGASACASNLGVRR
jgi:hypothetical protein